MTYCDDLRDVLGVIPMRAEGQRQRGMRLIESVENEVERLIRERDAARGAIDSIMEAIKGDRFSDGLQNAEDYVRYTLGTHGHLLHVEGYMDMCRQHGEAQAEADRLREAARHLIGVFMADATLDDPDGRWDAAINELEAAAGLSQQGHG